MGPHGMRQPPQPNCLRQLLSVVQYHPPRSLYRDVLVNHLSKTSDYLRPRYPCATLVLCGDFNKIGTTDLHEQLHFITNCTLPPHTVRARPYLTDMTVQYQLPKPMSLPVVAHTSVLPPPPARPDHDLTSVAGCQNIQASY